MWRLKKKKKDQADWAGAKGFREKGMAGEAHQELVRQRWTEGKAREQWRGHRAHRHSSRMSH